MFDDKEMREVQATEENTIKVLDLALDTVLFDAGRDGEEPTDEQKAGLNDLIKRALEMFNEGAPEGVVRNGVTIGGRILGVIDGEKHELTWHLCMSVKDEDEIQAAAVKDALREAIKGMIGAKLSESPAERLARILKI